MKPGTKEYLGDSVYAEWDGHGIVLTTNNGYDDDPRNRIVLEPEIYFGLARFVEKIKATVKDEA